MGKNLQLDDQRGPGRVRTPAPRPTARRQAKQAAYNVELEQFTVGDEVVRATRGRSVECLYQARDAVAHEAAALLWQRLRAVPGSREAARISSRRVAALAEVGSLTLAINKANPGEPSPERLSRVIAALRAEIEDAVRELFDKNTSDRLLLDLCGRLPDAASLLKAW